MNRLALCVLPLLCAVCLVVFADDQKKEVPAKPKAEKEAAKKPAQVKIQPVQVAVQIGVFNSRYGWSQNDRAEVDRDDDLERFLLLLPRGPIVVEAKIALDGEPFRVAREKLVDEMIAAADTDGDGKSTWKEAVKNPHLTFGRTHFQVMVPVAAPAQQQPNNPPAAENNGREAEAKKAPDKDGDDDEKQDDKKKDDKKPDDKKKEQPNANNPPAAKKMQVGAQVQVQVLQIGNPGQEHAVIKYFDQNKNGLLDRAEARLMLARSSGGPTFSVFGAVGGVRQPDVKSVLDQDKDGNLSAEEIAAASERLQSRDANGNDLLEASELGGTGVVRNAAGNVVMVRTFTAAQNTVAVGHLLGPTADYPAIFTAMQKKYGRAEGAIRAAAFSRCPALFTQLDSNSDGQLTQNEVANLDKTEPHIRLETSIGSDGKQDTGGVVIKSIAKEYENQDAIGNKPTAEVALELPDVRLRFVTAESPLRKYDYSQTAKRMVDRYDTNKNGFVEEKEMVKVNVGLKQQFQRWDMNTDGKVYAAEITESYRRQQAPMLSRVATQVGEEGPSLFAALDQSGDQRLSLREMKTAAEQLKSKDKNGDGQLGLDELPVEVHVSFGRGNGSSANVVLARAKRSATAAAKTTRDKGPEWFARMDRNGDGDVTLREFLGSEAQFQEIDANKDGFIELKEAEAVKLP